jgi:hypothetical protein
LHRHDMVPAHVRTCNDPPGDAPCLSVVRRRPASFETSAVQLFGPKLGLSGQIGTDGVCLKIK